MSTLTPETTTMYGFKPPRSRFFDDAQLVSHGCPCHLPRPTRFDQREASGGPSSGQGCFDMDGFGHPVTSSFLLLMAPNLLALASNLVASCYVQLAALLN